MTETMIERINSLRSMTVGQLREKYRDVFGEETKSGNKDWLWRRVAWRIQELEYGGLPERAKRRAAELANEADIRVRVPKDAFAGHSGEERKKAAPTGSVLTRKYKGRTYSVRVLENGFQILTGLVSHIAAGIDTPEQYQDFVNRYRNHKA